MAKKVAVVIQEDPRKTHRPVEALRIALGLVAGTHETTVVLLNDAVRLLSEDLDDVVDADILEKNLPSIEHLEIPFIVQHDTDRELNDAKRLFEWVLGVEVQDDAVIPLPQGPRLQIIDEAPKWSRD